MTKKQLRKLGFKKEWDKTDPKWPFYYYTLDIGKIGFITQADNELKNKKDWRVFLFDHYDVKWKKYKDLKPIVKSLKKATLKKKKQ